MGQSRDFTIYGLWHPGRRIYSGYGLSLYPDRHDVLVGLLMVDRPQPVDQIWLGLISVMYGHVELYQMTLDGSAGIACQMFITEDSRAFVRPVNVPGGALIGIVLATLLADKPAARLEMSWDRQRKLWNSQFLLDAEGAIPGQPRFQLGDIVATPGAVEALAEANQAPTELLHRHVTGDWGSLCQEDIEENERSVRGGFRILSSYVLSTSVKLWVITEYDRSVTTLLLPSEY
jgi:hypothetical protein